MKIKTALSVLLALALALGSLPLSASAEQQADVSALYKNRDVEEAWSPADAQAIDLDAAQGGTVTISQKGEYVLSGTLNGQVVIEAPEDAKVRLILNGVTIASAQGPAIYEKQADKLIITLAEGTVNTLTDGPMITDEDDTVGAALYAEDDLSLNGTGSLIAHGTQKHGIQSKADLIIANGNIAVDAVKDGVRGRNSLLVLSGTLNVTAGGDGLTATRTDAEGKGWIVLAGGDVTVKTGGGAGTAQVSAGGMGNMGGFGGFGGRGRRDDWGSAAGASGNDVSQKAVKAAADLTVLGGTYAFDCADDGLHGVSVTVSGGTFAIQSGDDAMHADEEMTVNGGFIDIAQCYEGLEGKNVTVNGGDIRIVSSDDGVNASGGSDGSGFGGWGRGGGSGEMDNGGRLTVSGGTLAVTAGGDGLDSNGSIAITGGVTGVWTAGAGMEGPIDFNGSGTVTGGVLIEATAGAGGGWGRGGAGLSGQKTFSVSVSGQAGDTVVLTDRNGSVLGSFTPGGSFGALTVSAAGLDSGGFTLTVGGRTVDVPADSAGADLPSGLGNGNDGDFGHGHGRRGR